MSADNWTELFHLIGIPKGMTLEKLTFGDIISHSDGIINNAEAIKVALAGGKEEEGCEKTHGALRISGRIRSVAPAVYAAGCLR